MEWEPGYGEKKAAEKRRYIHLRESLAARGLLDGPYPAEGTPAAHWLTGYTEALRDLSRYPEIVRSMGS